MSLADLINRFFGIEKRVRRALPIRCVPPLIAVETVAGTVIRDTRVSGYLEDFDGWVTDKGPNGESDYTGDDGRYWVRKGLPAAEVAETDSFTFGTAPVSADEDGNSLNDDIVTVANEPELPQNSAENPPAIDYTQRLQKQRLRIGQHVRVRAVYATDGTRHYAMNEPILFPQNGITGCDLTKTSGGAGSDTAFCSYLYTAKYPMGSTNVVGTNLTPKASICRAFPMKVDNPATEGELRWTNGSPTLTWAYETTTDKSCTA